MLLGAPFLIALAIGLSPTPASAQSSGDNCLQDQYAATGQKQTLGCTAGDVKVASVDPNSVEIFQGGLSVGGDTCIAGGTFSFTANFTIDTTSESSRSNVGIYFARQGDSTTQNGALTGMCSDHVIMPPHTCTSSSVPSSITCGSGQYDELDSGEPNFGGTIGTGSFPAGCGDTSSSDSNHTGIEVDTIELDNVACPTPAQAVACPSGYPAGDTKCLPVNWCTSWQTPGKALFCQAQGPSYYDDTAIPGAPSKCGCGVVYVPVQPVMPSISVTKSCTTGITTTASTTCDAGAGDVANNNTTTAPITYTVNILNNTPSGEGSVVIDRICDSVYGTIINNDPTSNPCPSTSGSIDSTTCAVEHMIDNQDKLPGQPDTYSCTFHADQAEDTTVTDTVTVSGHSSLSGGTFGPTGSNSVTVTSSDSPSSETTTNNLGSTDDACVTETYEVTVQNTGSPDETLTLGPSDVTGPYLQDDKYGDITSVHGDVLGTTCGQGTSGLGTLSGLSGAGTFPDYIDPGSSYTCEFQAKFCDAVKTVEAYGTGTCDSGTKKCTEGNTELSTCNTNSDCDATCTGISLSDTVTPTLETNEGPVGVCTPSSPGSPTGTCTSGENTGSACSTNADCNSVISHNDQIFHVTECLTPDISQ